MAVYSYLAVNNTGKQTKGNLEADTRDEALSKLKLMGELVINLQEAGALNKDIEISFLEKKPKVRDLSVFCRQFVSIISAGVPLVSALEMLGDQTENKMLAKATRGCKNTIEQGETLSVAMSDWPKVFPPIFVTMVEAGEASGSLELSFERMASQFEKEAKIKQTIKKATVYPIVISIIATLAIALMLTFVVPTFKEVLAELGVPLPGITVFVLGLSDFLQKYFLYLLVAIGLLVYGLRVFKKTEAGQLAFGTLELKLPLFGDLAKKTASARMARTLQNLLGSGLPLVDALSIVSNTMTNIHFKRALLKAREAVTLGAPLASQFKNNPLFPPLVQHMIGIGEETGSIEDMLAKLAEYYEEEVESATERLMAALEPAIIVVLAVTVGGIVLSIMMPMAAMYNGLNNL